MILNENNLKENYPKLKPDSGENYLKVFLIFSFGTLERGINVDKKRLN
jgi:hypothetical protein